MRTTIFLLKNKSSVPILSYIYIPFAPSVHFDKTFKTRGGPRIIF